MEAATGSTEKYWGRGRGREAAQGGADPSSAQSFLICWARDDLTGKVKLSWGIFYRRIGEVTAEGDTWNKRSLKREGKEFEGKHSLPGWLLGAASPSALSSQRHRSRGR